MAGCLQYVVTMAHDLPYEIEAKYEPVCQNHEIKWHGKGFSWQNKTNNKSCKVTEIERVLYVEHKKKKKNISSLDLTMVKLVKVKVHL